MLFAVDVDGTIAGANVQKFAMVCNEMLKLGIQADILDSIRLYREFFALPEVVECCKDKDLKQEISWCMFAPQVLLSLPPFKSALPRLERLSSIGTLRYYTARKTSATIWQDRNPVMAEVTHQWLTTHGFPQPHEVVFCESVKDKLLQLAICKDEVVLIDDHIHKLLSEFSRLDMDTREALRHRLTLMAFRNEYIPEHTGDLRVHACPSWQHLDRFIEHWETKGCSHDDHSCATTHISTLHG